MVPTPNISYTDSHTHTTTTDIFVDNVHIELSLWDTAGQEEFDRLRSLSYDDTHTIMLCFSVDSKDSLENVESKWVGEIAENCQGVKLVLVALKCDLREKGLDEEDQLDRNGREKVMIDYKQGLEVAKRIQALRYLGEPKSIFRSILLGKQHAQRPNNHRTQNVPPNETEASTKHLQKPHESRSPSKVLARPAEAISAKSCDPLFDCHLHDLFMIFSFSKYPSIPSAAAF